VDEGLIVAGSNIKGAPIALTPDLVADFVAWLDRAPIFVGADLSSDGDSHVVLTMEGDRIVSIEDGNG
jgi:hypothetical protein